MATDLKSAFPRRMPAFAASLLLSAALSACAAKHPAQLPPPPPPAASTTTAQPEPMRTVGIQPGSQADFLAEMAGRDTIHFAFDKSDIDQQAVEALQAQAHWLQRYPAKRATIEGHCDERGTREYNLALGERRATAAKNYLIQLGVAANRINVISYGKERPVDPASNEEAWAKNRRAVTVTID
ncbi:peptidoglycan-associated lipoprotein Pal [Novosphingobium sp. FSW06-99]|uniref:peptidoglycan-associated lipoprotein Pal n=1 Tax=Novosphingobium sp. FSW06-99 TaxID=1739113 RepID=UPI000A3E8CB8